MTVPTTDLMRTTLRHCFAGVGFAAFVGLFVNCLQLMVPLYSLQVYDRVMASRSLDTLTMLTLLACGTLLFLGILDYIRSRVFMIVGERFARRLNATVLAAAVSESLRSQSPASANAMRDLQELRQFVTGGPVALPLDAAFAPLFLVILYVLHPAFAAIGAVAIVVMVALGLLTELLARRPSLLANEAGLKSHAEVAAAIRNAEVIEAMGMRDAITRRWQRGQNRALSLIGAGNSVAKAIASISRMIRLLVQMAVVGIGAILVIDHVATPGATLAVMVMMGRLLHPFDQLIDGWRQWSNAGSALARLRQLLDGFEANRGDVAATANEGRLVIDGLTFVPPGSDKAVLRNVRFTAEPGDVIGVVGPSGAGKSTLARLLVGVWRPTMGGIYLDGHDVYTWERESFGRQVGYLPQNAVLLDGTVAENIARFQDANLTEVVAAAKLADVHELIGRLPFGYETRVGEGRYALSGGQRQRIALARALFRSPRLIVLDEPNSNVDAAGEQALLNAIREAKRAGTTVVIIAHRVSVMSAADKLLVLRDGAVEQFGPRSEIAKSLGGSPALPARVHNSKVAQLPLNRALRA